MPRGSGNDRSGPWSPHWWQESPERRAPLTREQLVRHALALLEDVGFDGLTMRGLAARAGVKAPSLYNHLRDKDELLAMAADAICAEVLPPDPDEPWRAQLESLAHRYRRVLLARREGARVLAATPPLGLNRLRLIESVLEILFRAGFAPRTVAAAAFAFNSYVVGFVLDETQSAARGDDAAYREAHERMKAGFLALPPQQFPRLTALAPHFSADTAEHAFVLGLECLLDGLQTRAV